MLRNRDTPYYFNFDYKSVYGYYVSFVVDISGKLLLYSFPDCTGYSVSPAVVRTLTEQFKNNVGIKGTHLYQNILWHFPIFDHKL